MAGSPESARPNRAGGVSLDDLRRLRGEGWHWARAQTDRCPQCGHHPAAMEQAALGTQLMESADAWRAFLTEADESYLRTVWDSYNRLGRDELADDLEDQARRLATMLDGLEPAQWSLAMIRDGGKDGVNAFTVAGLASYAAHEAHHHLLDANGTLPSTVALRQG